MDVQLKGKVALVVGASHGIGRATALTLAAAGARVAAVSRSGGAASLTVEADGYRRGEHDLDDMVEQKEDGSEIVPFFGDFTVPADAERVVAEVTAHFGTIDILVNTIGLCELADGALDADDDLWMRTWDSVVMTAVRSCRLVIPIMKANGGGAVVNTCAMSVRSFVPEIAHYSASKAALAHYTHNLAKEFGRDHVRVNAVMPGLTIDDHHSPQLEEFCKATGHPYPEGLYDALQDKFGNVTYSYRLGRPQDLADAICFLVSDQAEYISGAMLNVDGGSVF